MTVATEKTSRKYTAEEYLEMEDQSVEKHHFINGEIIPMPGAAPTHNLIAMNIGTQLNNQLEAKEKEYFVLNSDSKIFIPRLKNFVYPDAVVVCEEIEMYPGSKTVITNPLLIIEVLSPSTARYDRIDKFFDYKRIPSFKEYMLVEQDLPLVTTFFKTADHLWEDAEADGLDTTIYLRSIDCSIDLRKIYRGIKF